MIESNFLIVFNFRHFTMFFQCFPLSEMWSQRCSKILRAIFSYLHKKTGEQQKEKLKFLDIRWIKSIFGWWILIHTTNKSLGIYSLILAELALCKTKFKKINTSAYLHLSMFIDWFPVFGWCQAILINFFSSQFLLARRKNNNKKRIQSWGSVCWFFPPHITFEQG